MTRGWRIASIVFHVLTGLILAALALPLCGRRGRLALIKWWCGRLLRCFNLQVTASGQLPRANTKHQLLVANHISWVDIHAINSILPVRFVAKLEIKDWPVFGYLVRKSGTIFINRTRQRDAARVVQVATQALKLGDNLCVFPEGTTTVGDEVLPFKSSLIQAAIDAHASIIPVAIRYPLPDGRPNPAAAYAGDTTMAESMQSLLRLQTPVIHLHFCKPLGADAQNRQQLAAKARENIVAALSVQTA